MVTRDRWSAWKSITLTAILMLTAGCGAPHSQGDAGYRNSSAKLLIDGPRGAGLWHHNSDYEQDSGPTASRRWLQGINDFTELVHSYRTNSEAVKSFAQDSPEKVSSDVYQGARAYDIRARMVGADEANYACGTFEGSHCLTWWAWTRYGSYTVEFRYRRAIGDDEGLTDAQLATVIGNAAQDLNKKYRTLT